MTINIGTDFSGIEAPIQALIKLNINYRHVFSCDIDQYCKRVITKIYQPGRFYDDISTRAHEEVEPLDLYVFGFPCQAFSLCGRQLGFDDVRGTLFFNSADFIRVNRPKIFIAENVKGLLSHDKGKTFRTIINLLASTENGQTLLPFYEDNLGYHIYHAVLNASEYGLPQNRERVFIVGFRDEPKQFRFAKPVELHNRLSDIIDARVDEKYYLSRRMVNYFYTRAANFNAGKVNYKFSNDIASCITSSSKSLDISDNILVVSNSGHLVNKIAYNEMISKYGNDKVPIDFFFEGGGA
jgi:DNA (cytosine-5)-methyltransferase 1